MLIPVPKYSYFSTINSGFPSLYFSKKYRFRPLEKKMSYRKNYSDTIANLPVYKE
jgi:hypothetical protein